jgi:hypothetical protein
MMDGKTAEEICKTFNIECDHTPHELEMIKNESEWCEEK